MTTAAELDLKALLGPDCLLEAAARRARVRDCWPQALWWSEPVLASHEPLAVVRPEREEQVAETLNWSLRHGVPVVPRGGGSGVLGAAIPGRDSIVLDLTRLTSKFELSSDARGPLLTVAAGRLGGELEDELNGLGYSLCHFPASMAVSTVGGWVATRSFGQLSTRYGGIESQALSIQVVRPGLSPQEEAPGTHLGAEGTLGVITQATLRLRAVPELQSGRGLEFDGLGEALGAARSFACAPGPKPSVVRLYSPADAWATGLTGPRLLGGSGNSSWGATARAWALAHHGWLTAASRLAGRRWLLIVIYEGTPGEIEERWSRAGLAWRKASSEPARRWWGRRYHWDFGKLSAMAERGCFADTLDVWAPWEGLPDFERGMREALAPHAFVLSHFSHFDERGACLYLTLAGAGRTPADSARLHEMTWRSGLEACVRLGGRVNHHHGVGLAKLPWLSHAVDPGWLSELRRAKRETDPQALLNPGKLSSPPLV